MRSLIKPLPKGRYVVGVSGGVDSMALLDMLCKQSEVSIVVAHVDHGIRANSQQDRTLVESVARSHNMPFEYCELHLEKTAGETKARQARYNFLRHICEKYSTSKLILAHHADDVLETACINLIRGTGRKGLSSLRSHDLLLRPLLTVPKQAIVAYAKWHNLTWQEDATNTDQRYLRNLVRHTIVARMKLEQREHLAAIIVRQHRNSTAIQQELHTWLKAHTTFENKCPALPRHHFIMMPKKVALELLQQLCVQTMGHTLEATAAERAMLFIKTAKSNKQFVFNNHWRLFAKKDVIIVEPR